MRVIIACVIVALMCFTAVNADKPSKAADGGWNGFWVACTSTTQCNTTVTGNIACQGCVCDTYFGICVLPETSSNNGSWVAISNPKERRTGEIYFVSYLGDGSSSFRPKTFNTNYYRLAPSNLQDAEAGSGQSAQSNATYTTNIVLHIGLVLDISYSISSSTTYLQAMKDFSKSLVSGAAAFKRKVYFTLASFDRSTVPNFLSFQTTDFNAINSQIDGLTGPRYRGSAVYAAVNTVASVMRNYVRSFGSDEAIVKADHILQVIVVVTDGYSNAGTGSFNSDTTGFVSDGNILLGVTLQPWGSYDTSFATAVGNVGGGSRAKFLNTTNLAWGAAATNTDYGTNVKDIIQIFADNVVVSEICYGSTFSAYTTSGSIFSGIQEFPSYYSSNAYTGTWISNVDVLLGAATSYTGGRQCAALQNSDKDALASAASSTVHPTCLVGGSTPYNVYICQINKGVYCGGCDGFSGLVIPPNFGGSFTGLSNYQALYDSSGAVITAATSSTDNWFLYIVRTSVTKNVGLSLSSNGNNTDPLGFRIWGARGATPNPSGTYDVYSPSDQLLEWTTCGVSCRSQQWQIPCGTSASVSSPRAARAFQDIWYFRVDFCVPHSALELITLPTSPATDPAKGPLGLLSPNQFKQRRASAIDPVDFKASTGVSSGVTASVSVFAVLFVSFASYFAKMF